MTRCLSLLWRSESIKWSWKLDKRKISLKWPLRNVSPINFPSSTQWVLSSIYPQKWVLWCFLEIKTSIFHREFLLSKRQLLKTIVCLVRLLKIFLKCVQYEIFAFVLSQCEPLNRPAYNRSAGADVSFNQSSLSEVGWDDIPGSDFASFENPRLTRFPRSHDLPMPHEKLAPWITPTRAKGVASMDIGLLYTKIMDVWSQEGSFLTNRSQA